MKYPIPQAAVAADYSINPGLELYANVKVWMSRLTLDAAEHIMHVRTMALFPLPSFLLYCLVFHYYSSCINDEMKPTDVHSPGGGRCFASLLFFFLLLYFPSLQNPVVELCYRRSLSLHCASCMHTCIHQWPVTNTQEPLSANKKKNNSLCKEETAPCCFLSVVVANHMFPCLRANVEWVKTWLLSSWPSWPFSTDFHLILCSFANRCYLQWT